MDRSSRSRGFPKSRLRILRIKLASSSVWLSCIFCSIKSHQDGEACRSGRAPEQAKATPGKPWVSDILANLGRHRPKGNGARGAQGPWEAPLAERAVRADNGKQLRT